jgi:hypothetical protein
MAFLVRAEIENQKAKNIENRKSKVEESSSIKLN